MNARRRLSGYFLGRRDYAETLELQERLHAARLAGTAGDSVLFVEHPPVITFGRGAHPENVLATSEELRERGISLVQTGRGGDVTLHAPGQLVGYPILDLAPERKDVRRYVRDLAEVMRRVAAGYGIDSGLIEEHVGLWANRRSPGKFQGEADAEGLAKLGAIGVRISRWITMHGFALNLTTELDSFSLIVPCGIRDYGVTSVAELGGGRPEVGAAARAAFEALLDVFDADEGASSFVDGAPLFAEPAATAATLEA